MNQKSEDGKYISEVDVTQDGKPERIVIDAEAAGNPKTGEEPTVQVFSGETGKMIWSLPVNTVHAGYNNVYIYQGGNHSSLMTWNPAMWQGSAVYVWKVFDLTEEGKEKILYEDTIAFREDQPEKGDIEKLQRFAERLNRYLAHVVLLISTEGGTLRIGDGSTWGEALFYDPEEEIREMNQDLAEK